MSEVTEEEKPGIEEVLFKQGILFDLDIGRWGAHRKLDKDDLAISNVDPNAFYLGHKKLLPKEAIDKVYDVESKARSALMSCSSDFPIAGARFVRYPVLEGLLEKLATLKIQFLKEVKDLIDDYPALMTKQLGVLNLQAESLATAKIAEAGNNQDAKNAIDSWLQRQFVKNGTSFPEVEELKTKFRFEWRMFKVSAADSLNLVSADQAIEAHKKLQGDLQDWVHETAILMHQTLGEAAKHAKGLLEKQGKLNPKNLKPLFDAFESFKNIDIAGSDIQTQLDDIKKKYAYMKGDKIDYEASANMLNSNTDAMSSLKDLLSNIGKYAIADIAKEAGEEALSKVLGYGRSLDAD